MARSPSNEEVIAMVRSLLTVRSVNEGDGFIWFAVDDREIEAPFVRLTRMLDGTDVVCRVESADGQLGIFAHRVEHKKEGFFFTSPWVPRALFAVVVSFVMVDGYVRTEQANEIVGIGDPLASAAAYTLALLGILGTHELGHLAASWHHRLRTTWPYFIPGLPVIGIPTFGAFIQSRGVTVNRRILFDVAIGGPVAGLAVTAVVVVVGASTAPVLTVEEADALELSEWSLGEPLLMRAAIGAFGGAGEGTTILLTPMLFAAWIGFFITFLNMLPAWQLDGGHMARVLLGRKWHRYATYGSIALLALLNQWAMAILIIVLSTRSPGAEPLDDVTPLTASRKAAFAAMAALAFLCAPLPPAQLDAVLGLLGA
ncbi:MAG: site-2 protease family protein [Thaumarchaeota archaeon S13]|nr:MAG: site-2 protease family protein [Thaumarchaeota archaeon S13]